MVSRVYEPLLVHLNSSLCIDLTELTNMHSFQWLSKVSSKCLPPINIRLKFLSWKALTIW